MKTSIPCQVKDELRSRRVPPCDEVSHVCTTNIVAFLIQKTLVRTSTPFVKLTPFLYIVCFQYKLLSLRYEPQSQAPHESTFSSRQHHSEFAEQWPSISWACPAPGNAAFTLHAPLIPRIFYPIHGGASNSRIFQCRNALLLHLRRLLYYCGVIWQAGTL